MCKAIEKNSIVNTDFVDACAFEDVITNNINNGATSTNWHLSSQNFGVGPAVFD